MPIVLVTVFWAYVTGADILATEGRDAVLEAMRLGPIYAPWVPRLIEHLVLYPTLLGCLWLSRCIGWRPYARRVPAQAALGLVFSSLAVPSLLLGELVAGDLGAAPHLSLPSLSGAAELGAMLWLSSVARFLLAYAFSLALVSGIEIHRALSSARLASLRTQLPPHSLFNLLHTLHGQIGWNPSAARALVVRLGDLLRRLLTASEHEFWLLGEEVRFSERYLELQQQRFAERLRLSMPAPEGLPGVWVPSLILQPLVENAVVHGLRGHRGAVSIRLEITAVDEQLMLRVTNTVASRAPRRAEGIGLRNVRRRLALHFGERATVRADAGGQGEWMAEIRLPLLSEVRGT